jgi:hypothetical protein
MAATVTQNRVAFHANLRGIHGLAIRDAQDRVWFLADTDQVTRLSNADIPALHLNGRVDISAEQRLADLAAGGAAWIATHRAQEAA